MHVKIDVLMPGTLFTYQGKQYEKGSTGWSSVTQKEYLGDQVAEPGYASLTSCHPKLGGQIQQQIKLWFNNQTTVFVE
jgi:hypothetical protein